VTSDLNIINARVFLRGAVVESGVSCKDGKIVKVGKKAHLPKAEKTVDAKRLLIIPGVIDAHVHVRDPGAAHKEDWRTCSAAAAAGGVTTVLDMPNNKKPTVDLKTIIEKKRIASKKSLVDYGVYCGVTEGNINALPEFAEHVCGFKLYLGETTGSMELKDPSKLSTVFKTVSKTNKILVVHTEDGKMVDEATEKNRERTDDFAHADSHPPEAEEKAVERVLALAGQFKAKTHVTHLSSAAGLKLIDEAKKNNVDLSCDVTPPHLFLTRDEMKGKGGLLKVTPPLREKAERRALWRGVVSGSVDFIATDHAPHTLAEKEGGVWAAASGLPGVETSLPLFLNQVNKKTIDLNRLVDLLCVRPAERFGFGKGVIEAGFDADLVLVDIKKEKKVKASELHSKCGWTPYEGKSLRGWPKTTIVGGQIAYQDGVIYEEVRGKEVEYK